MTIEELFEKHHTEFLKFERVENKFSGRADLHAFILLDKIFPGESRDIISGSDHDVIWLDSGDLEHLTEEQIIELLRCGVRLGDNGLEMFT